MNKKLLAEVKGTKSYIGLYSPPKVFSSFLLIPVLLINFSEINLSFSFSSSSSTSILPIFSGSFKYKSKP